MRLIVIDVLLQMRLEFPPDATEANIPVYHGQAVADLRLAIPG